jgi:hypothetical protein
MIQYIEKGYGLHQWLANQGIELRNVDGVWVANVPDEQVSQLIANYNPWPAEKAFKLTEINHQFEVAVANLTAGTTESERNSWAIQEREARDYPQKTPVALTVLAASRGMPLDVLIEKVLQKSALYQNAYFTLQGMRDKAEDLIKALPDDGQNERLPELWAIKFGG